VAKFRRCVPFASRPVTAHAAGEVIDLVAQLENSPDVRRIAHLLSAAGGTAPPDAG